MNNSFKFITSLEYRLKAATAEVMAFKSGEKYIKMKDEFQKELRRLKHIIKKLEEKLSAAHAETITVRNQWFEVFDEMEEESDRKLQFSKQLNKRMEKRALKAERELDTANNKITEQRREIYVLKTEIEELKGKNLKLRAQNNRDYENSSLPSSKTIKNKKITNCRESSGRKPGGQPGHVGHGRKKQEPSDVIVLSPPQKVLEDQDFKKTSKTIVKQLVGIRVILETTEYHADVYYNSKTGERAHAAFPEGVIDDVNYDGSIKAFLFLLNNDCCVSIDKSRRFLSEITDGKLNISKGMINTLSKSLAERSQDERKKIFADMLLSPVMHTDCTNAKVNGKGAYVFVCATTDGKVLYFGREKKGHEGVKGTVVEDYLGTLVHDHDKTFYGYGSDHQECNAHILRYLKNSIENEPDRTWSTQMRALMQEMIHYRNHIPLEADIDDKKVIEFEKRYRKILEKAKEEYEYIPPSEYYKEGYNLYLRMEEYMQNHLLFLHDHKVPTTNNEAERLLRIYKRKQVQAVSFRSQESIDYLCQCMSMLVMMRKTEEINVFNRMSQIFG